MHLELISKIARPLSESRNFGRFPALRQPTIMLVRNLPRFSIALDDCAIAFLINDFASWTAFRLDLNWPFTFKCKIVFISARIMLAQIETDGFCTPAVRLCAVAFAASLRHCRAYPGAQEEPIGHL